MADYDRGHRRPNRIGVNADAADRFPPWSVQETKELLRIRADLDRSFSEIKHNRLLWISVADQMKAKGFNRNDEQCKCKWKNLVTRYKGCETTEAKAVKEQFPFYDDLHAIFTARMQKNWWIEAEERPRGSKRKASKPFSSDDPNNNKKEKDEEDEDEAFHSTKTKNKTMKKGKWRREEQESNLKEILKGFVKREMEMERQWKEAFRVREEERRLKEIEWRMNMEALEREKMMMEMMWREKEEERRKREEVRAEKRDALISALLNRLI